MANKPLNTAILDRAIIFAVRAHTGTERRGSYHSPHHGLATATGNDRSVPHFPVM